MDRITFLGTAGARYVVASQERASAGTLLEMAGLRILMDPGPGALVHCVKSGIDPATLDAVILTHAHIDHSNDVNIIIDAMTSGGQHRRGLLFAPRECIEGKDSIFFNYLRRFPQETIIITAREKYAIQGLNFAASVRHIHGVETYGLLFYLDHLTVSFIVDTLFFPGLLECYGSSDVLVLNVTLLHRHHSPHITHLCVDDARHILQTIRPKKAVLTHFGTGMLQAGPEHIAKGLAEDTGLPVLAATDGMTLRLDE